MATRTISIAGGNWNATTAWVEAQVPTAADDVVATALSGNLVVTASSVARSVTLTNYVGTLSGSGSLSVGDGSGGDFILAAGMTQSWSGVLTLASTTTGNNINPQGKSLASVVFNGVGGAWTLQGNFSAGSGSSLTLTNGSFNANNYNITTGTFASNNSNTRTLTMGNGTWTLGYWLGSIWNIATTTGLTFNANSSTIKFSSITTTFTHVFDGGGLTYNNFEISSATGVITYQFNGSNTFNDFKCSKTVASTIKFTAGTTTTTTTFTVAGTSGNVITIGSVTAATHTLTKAGGGTISSDYLSISYSTATPGTTWYAGTHSTDGGNNSGWTFTAPPGGSGGFLNRNYFWENY